MLTTKVTENFETHSPFIIFYSYVYGSHECNLRVCPSFCRNKIYMQSAQFILLVACYIPILKKVRCVYRGAGDRSVKLSYS